MAIIKDVIYCLNAKNEKNDGNTNANGILASILPEYIPGSFSFSTIVVILNFENKPCTINVKFYDPDDEKLAETGLITLPPQQNQYNIPDEYMGANLSVDWQNIVFKKEGVYQTIVEMDGEIFKKPIYVKGRNQ